MSTNTIPLMPLTPLRSWIARPAGRIKTSGFATFRISMTSSGIVGGLCVEVVKGRMTLVKP